MSAWQWPQWVAVAWLVLGVLVTSGLHGEPRTGKHSGPAKIIVAGIAAWVLWCGGFFGP